MEQIDNKFKLSHLTLYAKGWRERGLISNSDNQ